MNFLLTLTTRYTDDSSELKTETVVLLTPFTNLFLSEIFWIPNETKARVQSRQAATKVWSYVAPDPEMVLTCLSDRLYQRPSQRQQTGFNWAVTTSGHYCHLLQDGCQPGVHGDNFLAIIAHSLLIIQVIYIGYDFMMRLSKHINHAHKHMHFKKMYVSIEGWRRNYGCKTLLGSTVNLGYLRAGKLE